MGDSIGDSAAGAAVWSGGLDKVKTKEQCYKIFYIEKVFFKKWRETCRAEWKNTVLIMMENWMVGWGKVG